VHEEQHPWAALEDVWHDASDSDDLNSPSFVDSSDDRRANQGDEKVMGSLSSGYCTSTVGRASQAPLQLEERIVNSVSEDASSLDNFACLSRLPIKKI